MSAQWSDVSNLDDPKIDEESSSESDNVEDFKDKECYIEPDLAMVNDLIEEIERNPPGQEARILLMQHYAACGWHDAATEEAQRVLQIDSRVFEAQDYLQKKRSKAESRTKPSGVAAKAKSEHKRARKSTREEPPIWRPSPVKITSQAASLQELDDGYTDLLSKAEKLLEEMKLLKELNALDCEDQMANLAALMEGQVSSVVRPRPLASIKAVTDAIQAQGDKVTKAGVDLAVEDLKKLAMSPKKTADGQGQSRKRKNNSTRQDDDEIRKALLVRVKALKAMLHKSLQPVADLAMMHAEHEFLSRTYVNSETMVSGDPISDIPRANFWSSEDGYAWDMEELAGAIKAGKGVMRNPLSKQMFTRADIRAIIQHPLGKGLKALQVEQNKLKLGVRPQTIAELDKLAYILLNDTSEDGKPSHIAVEVFTSYLETLPTEEQTAIDELKVPAIDSHSGMAFDTTIGEAVQDVQMNKVCSHKTGDFLTQAVRYLR